MEDSKSKPSQSYGSIEDMPSIRELLQQFKVLSDISFLLAEDQRLELNDKRLELDRIISLVERFYLLLGPRNWVVHDSMKPEAIEEILANNPTPEEAEARLVAYYQDPEIMKWLLNFLNRVKPMRCRFNLIEKVSIDYLARRYHAVVPILIAQMDGLVNDIDSSKRKGLHARDPNSMIAWDSVTAHHMGLSHALKPFHESFRKTMTESVTEVYRHGILHGNIVSYDNEIVATKAWNLLFAVADWAYIELHPPKPQESGLSWEEVLERLSEGRRQRAIAEEYIANWKPWESDIVNCDERGYEVITKTKNLLGAWYDKR